LGGVTEEWTLVELAGRAAKALADVRARNGRVTELPDARMIRWYATIGVVDKPSGFRGRTALYGRRHLLQLVSVKRLQAQGLALAEIQAQLTGATEATLHRIAQLPEIDESTVDKLNSTVDGAERPRFWSARPTPAPEPMGARQALAPEPMGARQALAPEPMGARQALAPAVPGTVHGVSLPGGATLLVPAPVHPDQVAAIRRAAAPLLEYLSAHGLLNPDEGAHA
jgi:DNA-binding transcriptional MerR regulator